LINNKATSFIFILIILITSFLIRFAGYDNRMLWHDELWRINLILSDDLITRFLKFPDIYTSTTAPLYIGFLKVISFINLSPFFLRMSSLIPGILSPVLAYLIIKKASQNNLLALTCAFIFLVNLNFIHYSKEMKPYAFELFMHLLCLYAWTNLIFTNLSISKIYLLGIAMLLLILSGGNSVFIFPAICISTFYIVFKRNRQLVKPLLIQFTAVLLICLAMYYSNWQYGRSKGLHDFWDAGFYDPNKGIYLNFIIGRLTEMWNASFITIGSENLISIVLFASFIFSLIFSLKHTLYKNNFEINAIFILCITYLFTIIILNLLKMWPLGSLRTNLFIYGHFIIFIYLIISINQNKIFQSILIFTLVIVECISLPKIYNFDFRSIGINGHKTDLVWDSFKSNNEAYFEIQRQCQNDIVIVLTSNSMDSAKDYLIKKDLRSGSIKSILLSECVKIIRLPTDQSGWDYAYLKQIISEASGNNIPIWFLYGGIIDENLSRITETLSKFGAIKLARKFDISGYLLVVPKK
jgi:hypothetical protein